MSDGLVAVVLAAGEGQRLRPLTDLRPKALCPVGHTALLDWAVERVAPHVEAVAVNAHHRREQMEAPLTGGPVHLSVEEGEALGTAGAIGALREWIDGRDVLIVNSDEWSRTDLAPLVADPARRDRPRLLVVDDGTRRDFGGYRFAGASLLPWTLARELPAEPAGLWEACWRNVEADLDLVQLHGVSIDCGTPARYLDANLNWSGGASVIGPGARVQGEVVRSVVWPGASVQRGERLVDAIRADRGVTVWARRAA